MKKQINRLEHDARLNRRKSIRFWFDNRAYVGYEGDTLASGLLANGIHLVGRSFKYHRPRGIYTAGSEEPNALVQLEENAFTEPNRRATEIEIYEGLIAHSQNCWPSRKFDFGALNSWFSRLLPAGFYYKTFMWPTSFWMTYEKYIRKLAGLGRSPTEPDPHFYDKTYAHCDVLIIGGGPAGIEAATAAGQSGCRVILADEKFEFGGMLLSENMLINGIPCHEWIDSKISELRAMPNVKLLNRTTVTGYYDYNFLVANQRVNEHLGPRVTINSPKECLWKIRAKHVVMATGAIERPLVFADNDRPGIMLASAIRSYINRFSTLPGKNCVILTNNDSAYHAALDIADEGGQVSIIDIRTNPSGSMIESAVSRGIRIIKNHSITGVGYSRGLLRSIEIMELSEDGLNVIGKKEKLLCDLVGISGGWNPTIHLFSQSKGKLKFDQSNHCFLADQPSKNNSVILAGSCQATWFLKDCMQEGHAAGCEAAKRAGFSVDGASDEINTGQIEYGALRPLWILPGSHPIGQGKTKHFHELHNDATVGDIHLAVREGYESVEHLKRYTTTGMGTDQGKTSNLNALVALSEIRNLSIPDLGVTTFRPPYTPLSMGSIVGYDCGELFIQKRKTPIHPWHDQAHAVYEDVGDWKRPRYYSQGKETMHAAVQRECRQVRKTAGLLDASTLGKIDLQGKDTRWLLNMLYTNVWDKLEVGRCRYGLMLNEHGMIFDDGVTTRIAENHYHMTTTTGGAARVMSWIEEWLQTEWPDLEVYATSVTEQWAVASLNGPNAREILQELTDIPLDEESFPFMSMREGQVANIPARVFRISFTGELAYEINVPARHGLALWEQLIEVGRKFDICPYGTESMHVLRAEKGFIIVGQDTDGTVTPMDVGMDWIVSKKKQDFLGKRSFDRTDTSRSDRKQLVGLLTDDPQFILPEGAHVVSEVKSKPPMNMLGHITSSYMSPNIGRSIAIALLKDGFNLKGQTLNVALMNGNSQRVIVTDPVFLNV